MRIVHNYTVVTFFVDVIFRLEDIEIILKVLSGWRLGLGFLDGIAVVLSLRMAAARKVSHEYRKV